MARYVRGADRAGGGLPEAAPDAIARLARQGYGRRLELRHGQLWCPSCENTFETHDLLVDAIVPVALDAGSARGVLCALRCVACGASATWLVGEHDAEAAPLLEKLRAAMPSDSDGPP
jgi:hypothetical protein